MMEPLLQIFGSFGWTSLVQALLHSLWIGVVWSLLLAGGFRLAGSDPARRYALALAALAGIVLSTLVAWSAHGVDWGASPGVKSPTEEILLPAPADVTAAARQRSFPGADAEAEAVPGASPKWAAMLALFWAAGSALMFARLLAGLLEVRRTRRESSEVREAPLVEALEQMRRRVGCARPVRLAASLRVSAPAVSGFIAPLILFPAAMISGIPPEQFRAIIAHELAHIRRHDYLVNLVQQFIEALLFFNPAVWWINRQIRLEREACCDALAVKVDVERGVYGKTLVEWSEKARWLQPDLQPAFPGNRQSSTLLERLRRLMAPGYQPRVLVPWHSFLVVLLASSLLLLGMWRGSQLAVALAAEMLTPEQRIEKIAALKAAHQMEERTYTEDDDLQISGELRTWDGAPLPRNVQVAVNSFSPQYNASIAMGVEVTTGRFEQKVRFGRLHLGAKAEGYAPVLLGPLEIEPGGSTNLDIVLPRGFDGFIQVLDQQNRPLEGVELEGVYEHPYGWWPARLETDAAGQVRVPNVLAEPMRWTARAGGFQLDRKEGVRLSADEPLVWKLQPARAVSGRVLTREGKMPVAGAVVKLVHRGPRFSETHSQLEHAPVLAHTGGNGRFQLDSLPENADHVLAVEAEGFATKIVRDVRAGLENLEIELGPEILVRGEIRGDLSRLMKRMGEPVVQVVNPLQVGNSSYIPYNEVPVAVENGMGRFVAAGLREGDLKVTAGTKTFEYHLRESMTNLVINLDSAEEKAPGAMRQVVIRFSVPRGSPPVSGSLKVQLPDGPLFAPVVDGEARFEVAVPGYFFYGGAGLLGYWIPESHTTIEAGNGPLVLEVEALPAGAIHGKVLNADGSEAAGFLVSVVEAAKAPAKPRFGSLGEVGKNSSGSHEGPSPFIAQPLPIGGRYLLVAHRGRQFATSELIAVTAEQPIHEIVIRFTEGQDLTGVVAGPDGQPISGIRVSLSYSTPYGHGFGISEGVLTDAAGRFQFEGLNFEVPGDYIVIVDEEPGYQPVREKADPGALPMKVVLKAGLVVQGTVLNEATGNPLSGAELYAIPAEFREGQTHHFINADEKTDAQGRFTFSKLADRDYFIHCRSGRITNSSGERMRARAGQAAPLVVKIEPHKGVRLWEAGEPVVTR